MITEHDVNSLIIVKKLGFITAILSFIFYVTFDIAAIAGMTGVITSPFINSLSLYAPSLLLAYSYLGMTIAIHYDSISKVNIFSFCALALAVIYTTLNSIVYVIQVVIIAPSFLNNTFAMVSLFEMAANKPLYAVNGLAYTLMGFSTLFISFSIKGKGIERKTKIALFIHGIVAPTVFGALLYKAFFVLSATVGITYPISAILIAKYFASSRKELLQTNL
ncbi:MAG TPA: hypothetical protein PLP19_10335 [bacterium]|nr:hypothetical protein [bacterium]HPN43876.1 hypothetical protein [bacterium]